MVAGTEKMTDESSSVGETCRSLDEVYNSGVPEAANMVAILKLKIEGLNLTSTNVMTEMASIAIHGSGYIPEDERHFKREEIRVTNCHADESERCDNCILKTKDGEEKLDRIISRNIEIDLRDK